MQDQVKVEILTEGDLELRVSREPANRDLFGDDPTGAGRRVRRMDYIFRPSGGGLGEIFGRRKPDQDVVPPLKRHAVVYLGERIVAMAGLEQSDKNPKLLWVTYVAVEDDYQGRKLSRPLLEAIYDFACEVGMLVDPSSFSDMGKERSVHIFRELNARYPQAAFFEPGRPDKVCLDPNLPR